MSVITRDRAIHVASITLLLVIHLLFSYNLFAGWWYSCAGTILLLVFSFWIWGRQACKETGLQMTLGELLIVFAITILLLAGASALMSWMAQRHGIVIEATNFRSYFHIFFYTLNEEIVAGAVLLFGLQRLFTTRIFSISFGAAIVFTVVHYIFYQWVFLETGVLTLVTMIVLTLIHITRNNLILSFRHIGYAWALHFSWMAVMFGSHHYLESTSTRLTEPERFNLYLGSNEMLILSAVLAFLSILLLKKSSLKKQIIGL